MARITDADHKGLFSRFAFSKASSPQGTSLLGCGRVGVSMVISH